MTFIANFLSSLMIALGFAAIAVFAVQNITPVSLRLFVFESIQLPVGILLAVCISFGLILGAFLPLLWQRPAKRRTRIEDMDEFDFEFEE
ncbi:MAG: LapA family protein [Snowella sp.]|nr:LapA family protein [Snowella sp.]